MADRENDQPKLSPISRRAFIRKAAAGTLGAGAAAVAALGASGCLPTSIGYANLGYLDYSDGWMYGGGYYNDSYGNYNDSLYNDYVNDGYRDYANYDDYPNFSGDY